MTNYILQCFPVDVNYRDTISVMETGEKLTVHGPVGKRVAANITRRRTELDMNQRELAIQIRYLEGADDEELSNTRLRSAINSVSKMEQRKKRVDVDDLTTLAIALRTTPNWLMYDTGVEPPAFGHRMSVYPRGELHVRAVTNWANGHDPLRFKGEEVTIKDVMDFQDAHRPFEPKSFPSPMPERFEQSPQFQILKDAYDKLRAEGTKERFIVPMMHDMIEKLQSQEFDAEDFIAGIVPDESDEDNGQAEA